MINLMIIYNVVNIFSMKNHKSSRKLRVGVNWYPGVNWSTTTTDINKCVFNLLIQSFAFVSAQSISSVHVHCTKNALLSPKQLEFLHTNYGHPIILATDITENNV